MYVVTRIGVIGLAALVTTPLLAVADTIADLASTFGQWGPGWLIGFLSFGALIWVGRWIFTRGYQMTIQKSQADEAVAHSLDNLTASGRALSENQAKLVAEVRSLKQNQAQLVRALRGVVEKL